MSILLALRKYSLLLGYRGLLLAAKGRILRRKIEIAVRVPGYEQPLHLRLRSSDITVFQSIFLEHEYDIVLSKTPRVIVDAGANVGFTSVWYANKYPNATIIAIEPEKRNFEILQKNIAGYKNVKALRAALWKENKRVSIVDPGLGSWAFRVHEPEERESPNDTSLTQAFTLGYIMSLFGLAHVDILKVDIEGSEKEVFENSSPWIDRIGVIVIELHDRYKRGCSHAVWTATTEFCYRLQSGDATILLRKESEEDYSSTKTIAEAKPRNDRMSAMLPLAIVSVENKGRSG
jgi:FkbM family methyltransferase